MITLNQNLYLLAMKNSDFIIVKSLLAKGNFQRLILLNPYFSQNLNAFLQELENQDLDVFIRANNADRDIKDDTSKRQRQFVIDYLNGQVIPGSRIQMRLGNNESSLSAMCELSEFAATTDLLLLNFSPLSLLAALKVSGHHYPKFNDDEQAFERFHALNRHLLSPIGMALKKLSEACRKGEDDDDRYPCDRSGEFRSLLAIIDEAKQEEAKALLNPAYREAQLNPANSFGH